MSNTFVTPDIIARMGLLNLKNNCPMGRAVYREYQSEWIGKKVGETISIRKPIKFTSHDGIDITNSIADLDEATISMTVNNPQNVSWEISSRDLTLSVKDYNKRYVEPACITLANKIDYDLTGQYVDIYNCVGTAGTTISSFSDYTNVNGMMDNYSVPSNRVMVLNPDAYWATVDFLKGIFSEKVSESLILRGEINTITGEKILRSQNIRTHTHNTLTGTPLIDTVSSATYITSGNNASSSTIHVDGISAGALVQGDVFTVATVNGVNPVNRTALSNLQQFTMTAALAQATDMPCVVSPSIYTSGAYQTVDEAPADGDAVTFVDSHVANLAFTKNTFALAMIPLETPDGCNWHSQMNYDGYSISVIKDFDILKRKEIIRLDVMYAVETIHPGMGVRVLG